MMTNFVDVLNKILSGNEQMDLGEHNFIGGWIDRYLLECPKNRIATLLEMLANVFEKCVILQVSCDNGYYIFTFAKYSDVSVKDILFIFIVDLTQIDYSKLVCRWC